MRKFSTYLFAAFFLACQGAFARPLMPAGVEEDRLSTEIVWESVRSLKVGERPRIVLVLGGGGARGLSHIGVLRVFEQERVPIDKIVGISVGALMGSLYAGGIRSRQLETMANEIGWNKLTDISKIGIVKLLLTEELLSTKRMESYLELHLGKKHFSDLNIPFICTATDIQTGERVVFREGPVAIAARASATIPGIFHPVEYQGRLLADGGLSDVLPTDVASSGKGSIVIAVMPRSGPEKFKVSSILTTLIRSLEIQKDALIEEKKRLADFLIEPDLRAFSIADVSRSNDAIEAGTMATRNRMLDLKKLIIQKVIEDRRGAPVETGDGE